MIERYDLDYKWNWRQPKPDIIYFENMDGRDIGMFKDENGEWVKYSDVEKLQAENARLKKQLTEYKKKLKAFEDAPKNDIKMGK